MTVGAILLAGGSSSRYHPQQSKLLESLAGTPILMRSYLALKQVSAISEVVVVCHSDWQTQYQALLTDPDLVWTRGGDTRRESVWRGLQALSEEVAIVVIHDAARPLVQPQRIQSALQPVISGQAIGTSLGVPLHDSIKRIQSVDSPWITQSLDREGIWRIHTPQIFQREAITRAHQQITANVTDDAELIEQLYPNQNVVLMVEDTPTNLKITTQQDLALAEAFLTLAQPAETT